MTTSIPPARHWYHRLGEWWQSSILNQWTRRQVINSRRSARHYKSLFQRHPEDCMCDGEEWVWAHELPDPHEDALFDDTRYSCPYQDDHHSRTPHRCSR